MNGGTRFAMKKGIDGKTMDGESDTRMRDAYVLLCITKRSRSPVPCVSVIEWSWTRETL